MTSAQKTNTSIVLGNDDLPKKTTYQCTHTKFPTTDAKVIEPIDLSEVLPNSVFPPPEEPLRKTIYQEDFGSIDPTETSSIHREQQKTANIIAGIHHLPGVPLAPHADLTTSSTEPSQQQTAYRNKMRISKEWASIQKKAEQENATSSAYSVDCMVDGDCLPTEHQRQYRWPMTDSIHVVTYTQMRN